jgi:hypothetical protein
MVRLLALAFQPHHAEVVDGAMRFSEKFLKGHKIRKTGRFVDARLSV